ncbi:SCO family protein [Miltoncostaea marina]|uniref:SCO family protein n=1 Tax=Miltoncostaea marina TaxID=2843215 RepID=UPI001C3E24F0|nr:SCO family protein [Miltoncostaea marina]
MIALAVTTGLVAIIGLTRVTGTEAGSQADVQEAAAVVPKTTGRAADGSSIRLPSPAGRPAMVTFLFTECPDVCMLIAGQIAAALDRAGPAAEEIDVIAVSVDPEGDSPAAVRRFLTRYDLQGRMQYMVGTRTQLEPIWKAWGVAAQTDDHGSADHARESVHSAPIVFVDGAGRQVARYSAGVPYTPADLEQEIRALVG